MSKYATDEQMTAKWEWAALWKRAAKHHRNMADRYCMAWIKAVVRFGWTMGAARAWKAAAKKWRRRALEAEAKQYFAQNGMVEHIRRMADGN